MAYIAVISGPNLNLTGKREPDIYGTMGFEELMEQLRAEFTDLGFEYYQSNVEGDLVSAVQQHGFEENCRGILLNAGAYTHTSIAIADAIAAIPAPVVAVHLSNIFAREAERKTDLLVAKCRGMICGLGITGYRLGVEFLQTLH